MSSHKGDAGDWRLFDKLSGEISDIHVDQGGISHSGGMKIVLTRGGNRLRGDWQLLGGSLRYQGRYGLFCLLLSTFRLQWRENAE